MGNVTAIDWSATAFGRSSGRDRQTAPDDLPPPRNNHWVLRQKLAVVDAVNSGRLPLREAMRRYELSLEEFVSWQDAYIRDGASRPESAAERRVELVAEPAAEHVEMLELAY